MNRVAPSVCKMVVVDAQILRGTPVALLELLPLRGLRLHVSMIAFEEFWAQAAKERDGSLFIKRITRLAPLVDSKEPVKTTGGDLVRRIGGMTRGALSSTAPSAKAGLLQMWERIVSGRVPPEVIVESGSKVEAGAATRDAEFLATLERSRNLPSRTLLDDLPEAERTRLLSHTFSELLKPLISIQGGIQERFHAYFRYVGLLAARTAPGVPLKPKAENDAEDMQLLMHLGEGAFLATEDRDLIFKVDSSDTFQAPWVRTVAELASIELPVGIPWGKSARRAAERHVVRTRSQLKELDVEVRAQVDARASH